MLLIPNIIFNLAYSMMIGPFYASACQMDLRLPGSDQQINGAFFNIGDCFAIVLFVPLIENFFIPVVCEKWFGFSPKTHHKILCGFGFGLVAMAAAAVLEIRRRNAPLITPTAGGLSPDAYFSQCAPKSINPKTGGVIGIPMSDVSAAWMFLPYGLIGVGEILVNPTLYTYAFQLAPEKTKSLVQSMNLVGQGAFPSALSACLQLTFAVWQPDNLNDGHLENYYYLVAGVIVTMTPVYLWMHFTFYEGESAGVGSAEDPHEAGAGAGAGQGDARDQLQQSWVRAQRASVGRSSSVASVPRYSIGRWSLGGGQIATTFRGAPGREWSGSRNSPSEGTVSEAAGSVSERDGAGRLPGRGGGSPLIDIPLLSGDDPGWSSGVGGRNHTSEPTRTRVSLTPVGSDVSFAEARVDETRVGSDVSAAARAAMARRDRSQDHASVAGSVAPAPALEDNISLETSEENSLREPSPCGPTGRGETAGPRGEGSVSERNS